MAKSASDYHRGEMDISEQTATYGAVMSMSKWASLAIVVGVLFATLWFCTAAGFGAALVSAVIVAVIGFFALRGKSRGH